MGRPKGVLSALLEVCARPGNLFILPHDNPDPDALASAATLKYLLSQKLGREARIVLGGIVGRAENRAMVKYLSIELVPVSEVQFDGQALVLMVDTQPGRQNNSLPADFVPAAVIDHHPAYSAMTDVPFLDLRDQYGATSTMLTEYLEESHLDVEAKIATALFYGINAETQDLGREATPADVRASHFLYPFANKRRLAKIENARVPREYFGVFREAIDEAVVYDKVVISALGEVQYPDMVAEVADFLLRLDEVEWSAAIGCYGPYLHVSLRTTNRDANAGEVLQRVLGSHSAGGHDQIAGGRIRVGEGAVAHEKAGVRIKERLLGILGARNCAASNLV